MFVNRFIYIAASIMTLPIVLMAQTASPGSGSGGPTATFGSAVPTPLQFQGQATSTNLLTATLGVATLYNDNILTNNTDRVTDESLSLDSHVSVARNSEHVTIKFDYTPFFLFYRQYHAFNQLNHAADLNMTFRLSSGWLMRLHDAFSYQQGAYPAFAATTLTAGPASPTAVNSFVYSSAVRTLTNTPGVDLTFQESSRTSLTFSGGYSQERFGSPVSTGTSPTLYNESSFNGSVQYNYRVTPHTTFGLSLLYQDSSYQGGALGNQRSQIGSTFASLSSRLSPNVSITIYGGPQYIKTLGQVEPIGVPSARIPGQVEPSGGGSITDEVRNTALNLAVERAISNGGGLYTSAVNTNISLGVRRRLVGQWQASLGAAANESNTSLLQLGNGKTDSLIGTFSLSRTLGRATTFRVVYSRVDEVSKGNALAFANFDRDQVTVGIDYQLKEIPLGR